MRGYSAYLLLLILLVPFGSGAQSMWFEHSGGVGNDEAMDVANDGAGNVITTGYFTQGASFSGTVLSTTSVSDVFVSKYDNSGNLLWAKQCGGPGADRGLSVRADAAGDIYVTGYFSGNATFGAFTISSAGLQDIFVTKLDAAGNFLWARAMGGTYNDYGNGISPDNNGNVVVTGQFMGTADFGGGISFTGMDNPSTGVPTYEIFVAKLDATGNTVWVKPAYAGYDDRGMDVNCDAAGNVYVVGQFSDTITIDAVHYNTALNAAFLLKLDPAGNEVDFCRITSGQTISYSVAVDHSGNVNICGDYQGSLVAHTSSPVFVPSTGSKNIFIIRFDPSLEVMWTAHAGSSSEASARSIITDNAGHVFIAGVYRCRFDDYGAPYGTGMFYSVGFRDVFTSEYDETGTFVRAKNAGGPKDDFCGGIALSSITGLPVLAGSMNNYFHYTTTGFASGIFSPCTGIGQGSTIFESPNQQRDVFVGAFIDNTNYLVDVFQRNPDCSSDLILPRLGELGKDSMFICYPNSFWLNTEQYLPNCQIGACFDYTWNNGSHNDNIFASSSGWYWVTMERQDGCYANTDSLYIAIVPALPPLITDSYGENILQPPYTTAIKMCGSDTLILTAGNVQDTSSSWGTLYGSSFDVINDSTIRIYQGDVYSFVNINEYGCSYTNNITIIMDTFAITDTLHPFLLFNGSNNDTITLCSSSAIVSVTLNDTSYFNGEIMTNKDVDWYYNSLGTYVGSTFTYHQKPFFPPVSGWMTVYAHLSNDCAEDTVHYWVQDSVYILINPNPPINYTLVTNDFTCPYDTVAHVFYTDAMYYYVSATTPYQWLGDSVIYTVGSGNVYIQMSTNDTITGCGSTSMLNFTIDPYNYPEVTMSPSEGVVCPGDSVLLTVTEGLNYMWVGPMLDSTDNGQSTYASIPGFYYCVVTDTNGCTISSNTVETMEYSTPYMVVDPGIYFCDGETVTLSVEASPGAVYNWLPPLSGSATTQVVDEGGTYICEVTSCGIVTPTTAVLIKTEVPVTITAPDTLLCNGDTVRLSANAGMSEYLWSPTGSTDTVLLAHTPGTYTLTVMYNGCYNSSSVEVMLVPPPADPITNDELICPGNTAGLSATSGAPTLNWYDSTGVLLVSGTGYTTPVLSENTTYYIQAVNAEGCPGNLVPVQVLMIIDTTPELFYDSNCEGSDLELYSDITNPLWTYYWFGPGSYASADHEPVIGDVSFADEGMYGMYYSSGPGCKSDTAFIMVDVLPLPVAMIDAGISSWCEEDVAAFSAQDETGNIYNWYLPGPDSVQGNPASFVMQPANSGNVILIVTDTNGCQGSDTMAINVSPLPVITLTAPATVCLEDDFTLVATADVYDSLNISGPSGFYTPTLTHTITNANPEHEGLYTFEASLNGCSDSVSAYVVVVQHPETSLGSDTAICEQALLVFDLPGIYHYQWSTGSNSTHMETGEPGLLWVTVTDSAGCTVTDSIVIELLVCDMSFPNIFSPNGDGINDYFSVLHDGIKNLEMHIFNRWGQEMFFTSDPSGRWNGLDQDGKEAAPGVYFYTARVENALGKTRQAHGTVQLTR